MQYARRMKLLPHAGHVEPRGCLRRWPADQRAEDGDAEEKRVVVGE